MTSPEDLQRVCEQYATAWSNHDVDAVVALFATDAVVRDPIDGPAVEGADKLRAFWAEFGAPVRSMKLTGPVHISADCHHAASRYNVEADLGEGLKVVESIDVFTFDDDGLITTMSAYWGPTNFHDA